MFGSRMAATVAAVSVIAAGTVLSPIAGMVTSAQAATPDVLFLTNAPAPHGFADTEDNTNKVGQPIWMWDSTGNGELWEPTAQAPVNSGDGWPFSVGSLNTKYNGHQVVNFEDGHDDGLCLGESAGTVVLKLCTTTGSLWVLAGTESNGKYVGQLVNVQTSDTNGTTSVLSTPGWGNMQPIMTQLPGATGAWQNWTFG